MIDKKRKSTVPNNENEQARSRQQTIETEPQSEETMSTSSNDYLDVQAIIFEKYLGPINVRYFQMGRANHVQENKERNLEETVRQAEQIFSTIPRNFQQRRLMM